MFWFKLFNGILIEFFRWELLNSKGFLTSKILMDLFLDFSSKSFGEVILIWSIFFPAFFQLLKPPLRYPNVLSNPTLASLLIVSFSLPFGMIKSKGVEISSITVPTHGANIPSIPINNEFGIWPDANLFLSLTSSIITSLLLERFSNSLTLRGFNPSAITFEVFW